VQFGGQIAAFNFDGLEEFGLVNRHEVGIDGDFLLGGRGFGVIGAGDRKREQGCAEE